MAYEAARHSAELAAKAILLRETGSYPQKHAVAGPLFQEGLVPEAIDGGDLHRLVTDHHLGRYGFHRDLDRTVVQEAIEIAAVLVAALRG